MAFDYHKIKNWTFDQITHKYDTKDTILYALSIGLGQDPLDPKQLQFVYEENLKAMPTMAVILAYPGFWMSDPEAGIDWVKLVHGEQRLYLHQEIPSEGTVYSKSKISHIVDKGKEKGSIVITKRELFNEADELLATIEQSTFCRGDGGLEQSDEAPAQLTKVPARPCDDTIEFKIDPQAALIYRLNADPNPLHADPEVAKKAGYPAPILHGLCTYGIAAQTILSKYTNNPSQALKHFHCRFSAPVYPGETLVIEIWKNTDEQLFFQARSKERDIVVLSHGDIGIKNE